jgi:caspase domain-containing protein
MRQWSPNLERSVRAGRAARWLALPALGCALGLSCRPPAGSDGGPALTAEGPHRVEEASAAPSAAALSAAASTAAAVAEPPVARGRGSALLIAINDYLYDDDIPDLRGTINDATAMQDLLIRRFGFDPAAIVLLRDGEATKERVLAAFRELIERTEVDSPVVIYDSSHGSEVWDVSGDEPKSYDQTLVMHDSGRSEGRENRDLTDDELNGLLRELNRKTRHVTLIFDSCHSGTAVRASARPRAARPDCRGCSGAACGKCSGSARPGSRAVDGRPSVGGEKPRGHAGFGPDDLSYVLISGAASDEFSYERVVDGRPMGALTWALTRALWQAPPGTTYRDVMAQVGADVTSSLPAQHPQVEGRNIDSEVFGVRSLPVEPFLELRSDGAELALLGGAIQGVSVGSRYGVYPPGTKHFEPAASLGTLTVTRVDAVTAAVERSEGTAPLPPGARAVETHHQFDRVSLRVRIDAAPSAPALARAASALAQNAQIALVEPGAEYDLLLRQDGSWLEVERSTERDGSGPTATRLPDDQGAADQLVGLVQRWARWHALRQLASVPADADVTFAADAAGKSVAAGSSVTFSLRNASKHRYYLSLFALSSDGSISLVYPEPGANEFIEAGGQWKKTLQTCVPRGKSAVRDVAKLFLTREPHQLAFLEQGALERSASRVRSSLEDVLAARALGVTRGLIRPTQGTGDGWQTRQVAYDVLAEPGAVPCPASPSGAP